MTVFRDDWISDPTRGKRDPERLKVANNPDLVSVANDTKWRELRDEILKIEGPWPRFRCMSAETGRYGPWDGEWYYHWMQSGWEWMEWVDLKVFSQDQRGHVRSILKRIHFAGEETAEGFRIYGYIRHGQAVDYF